MSEDFFPRQKKKARQAGWANAEAKIAIEQLDAARMQWLTAGSSLDWRGLLSSGGAPEQAAFAAKWAEADGFDPAKAPLRPAAAAPAAPPGKKTEAAWQALARGETAAREFAIMVADGADEHAKDSRGFGSMHMAALGGEPSCIEWLARAGIGVDAPTVDGDTPLLLAAWKGRLRAVEALLTAGADPLARNGSKAGIIESAERSTCKGWMDADTRLNEIMRLGLAAIERAKLRSGTPHAGLAEPARAGPRL